MGMKFFSFLPSLSFVTLVISSSIEVNYGDRLQLKKNYLNYHLCSLFDDVNINSLNELTNALGLLVDIGKEESFEISEFTKESKNKIIRSLNLICGKISQVRIPDLLENSIIEGIKQFRFEALALFDLLPHNINIPFLIDLIKLLKNVEWYFSFCGDGHFSEVYKSQNEVLFSWIEFMENKLGMYEELDIDMVFQLQKNYRDSNLLAMFVNVDTSNLATFSNVLKNLWLIVGEKSFDKSKVFNSHIKDKIIFSLKVICEKLCDPKAGLDKDQQIAIIEGIKKCQYNVLADFTPRLLPEIYFTGLCSAVSLYLSRFEEFCHNTIISLDKNDFPFDLKKHRFTSLNALYSHLEKRNIVREGDSEAIGKIKVAIRENLKNAIKLLISQAVDKKQLINALVELKFEPLDKLLGLSAGIVDPHDDKNAATLCEGLKSLFISVYSLIINRNLIFKRDISEGRIPKGIAEDTDDFTLIALDKTYDEFMQEYLTQNVHIFAKIAEEKEEQLFELKSNSNLPFSEEKTQKISSKSLETIVAEVNQTFNAIYDNELIAQKETDGGDNSFYQEDEIYDQNDELVDEGGYYEAEDFDYEIYNEYEDTEMQENYDDLQSI
jgi:hypothetical protein